MTPTKEQLTKVAAAAAGLGSILMLAVSITHNQPTKSDEIVKAKPLKGLSSAQIQRFQEGQELFTHNFSIEEGLGPRYNAMSCYACHGAPGTVGGAGQNLSMDQLVHIGARKPESESAKLPLSKVIAMLSKNDVQTFDGHGGPILKKFSITKTFKSQFPDCDLQPLQTPKECEFIAPRIAPQVLGSGLLNAIAEEDLIDLEDAEVEENIDMAGRVVEKTDPLTQDLRVGRFGWKDQNTSLLSTVSEMMNDGLGVTTSMHPDLGTPGGINDLPRCLMPKLPSEPNDDGNKQLKLTYFLALTAPPERAEITPAAQAGEQVFEKLQCAFCHVPELQTKAKVKVVDPKSPAPELRYIEIPALENQPVRAYSDLLLHNMGNKLADGIPQGKAHSGEWRTPPLWGLRQRKYYLHNGSARTLEEAIAAHGGQGKQAADAFAALSKKERQDLLAFLRSL